MSCSVALGSALKGANLNQWGQNLRVGPEEPEFVARKVALPLQAILVKV